MSSYPNFQLDELELLFKAEIEDTWTVVVQANETRLWEFDLPILPEHLVQPYSSWRNYVLKWLVEKNTLEQQLKLLMLELDALSHQERLAVLLTLKEGDFLQPKIKPCLQAWVDVHPGFQVKHLEGTSKTGQPLHHYLVLRSLGLHEFLDLKGVESMLHRLRKEQGSRWDDVIQKLPDYWTLTPLQIIEIQLINADSSSLLLKFLRSLLFGEPIHHWFQTT